ncbi:putative nuclease [Brazilian marseillevirus]|uniref:putative nuclease n=1 Tax=Brazilian marseillevirus TaxID=1813599 RepID=UPI0007864403|nr:putative nuclease [Brazilian marseillevirus]AMQ10927.1 putative nuclease [Brazilian marseillevirus]
MTDKDFEVGSNKRQTQCSDPDLNSVFSKLLDGEISLEATYQRDMVWPETKQSMLIDSIFLEMYIPALLFSYREGLFFCVDGKQRLLSVQRFMSNEIPWKRKAGNVWYSNVPEKKTGVSLNEQQRRWFNSRSPMRFVTFYGLEERTEMQMFQRIQDGMQLKYTEKLLASQNPIVRYCVDTLQVLYGDEMDCLRSNKRKEHVLLFLRVCFLCKNGADANVLSSRKVQEFTETQELSEIKEVVEEVLSFHGQNMQVYKKKPLWFLLATCIWLKERDGDKTLEVLEKIMKDTKVDGKLNKRNISQVFEKVE